MGSTLVIANTNSGALNTGQASAIGDPWSARGATETALPIYSSANTSNSGLMDDNGTGLTAPNHQFIRPIVCAGWNYANFYHIWRGDNTVSQAPRIQVFGRVPSPTYAVNQATGARAWPRDDDPDMPDFRRIWLPLTQPGETNAYIEFPTTAGARFQNDFYISAPAKYVYLQGVDEIMVLISQVAAFSNTQLIAMSSGGSTDTDFSSSSSAGSDTSYGMIGVQFSG